MWIAPTVGVAMVITMVRGPPQRTALNAGGANGRKDKLQCARRPKSLMRKIAVVETSQCKHAHGIERDCRRYRKARHADPDYADAGQMQRYKGQRAQPVDTFVVLTRGVANAGVEPAREGNGYTPLGHSLRHDLRAPLLIPPSTYGRKGAVDAAQTHGAAGSVGLSHSLLMCLEEAPKSNGGGRDHRIMEKTMYINRLQIYGRMACCFQNGLNRAAIAVMHTQCSLRCSRSCATSSCTSV